MELQEQLDALTAEFAKYKADKEAEKAEADAKVIELTTKITEYQKAEAEAALTARKNSRFAILAEVGYTEAKIESRSEYYLALSDEDFMSLVEDVKEVRTKATAEDKKIQVPEPLGDRTVKITPSELAKALKDSKLLVR